MVAVGHRPINLFILLLPARDKMAHTTWRENYNLSSQRWPTIYLILILTLLKVHKNAKQFDFIVSRQGSMAQKKKKTFLHHQNISVCE